MNISTTISSGSKSHILCVGRASTVLMSDLSTKRIDRIQLGDNIATYSVDRQIMESEVVNKIGVSTHDDARRVVFEDGKELDCTPDHPIWVRGKGWCAVDPELAYENYGVRSLELVLGDLCLSLARNASAQIRVISIRQLPGHHEMYVVSAGENHCFVANGILVHDENVVMLEDCLPRLAASFAV